MKNDISFENAMQRLEEITKLLENPDVTLDESVELYKEGVELSAACKTKLDNARLSVTALDYNNNEKEI